MIASRTQSVRSYSNGDVDDGVVALIVSADGGKILGPFINVGGLFLLFLLSNWYTYQSNTLDPARKELITAWATAKTPTARSIIEESMRHSGNMKAEYGIIARAGRGLGCVIANGSTTI